MMNWPGGGKKFANPGDGCQKPAGIYKALGTYCEACGRGAPDVVVYDVRVRGEHEFTMCLKCREGHSAEVLR